MFLFKKIKRRRPAENETEFPINRKWKIFKANVALFLQRKSELVSVKAKRYVLLFFCLLSGGSSIAIIIHSAMAKEPKVSITQITKPLQLMRKENSNEDTDSAITKQEFERIEQFKSYLYQLKNDSLHSNQFDSIIKARPQLLDNINLFEKIYLQQK